MVEALRRHPLIGVLRPGVRLDLVDLPAAAVLAGDRLLRPVRTGAGGDHHGGGHRRQRGGEDLAGTCGPLAGPGALVRSRAGSCRRCCP